jgi:hypothetical protein
VLNHANPTSPLSSSPTPTSSSPTPASSSVAIVHPWPKVSTPSRSSRRFLSVLSFNIQFRCHPHRIPFTLPAPLTCSTKALPLVIADLPTELTAGASRPHLELRFAGLPACQPALSPADAQGSSARENPKPQDAGCRRPFLFRPTQDLPNVGEQSILIPSISSSDSLPCLNPRSLELPVI